MKEHEERLKKLYNSFLQSDGSFKMPLSDTPSEQELKTAEWFNGLPQSYQEGLLTEDVDKINAFLSSLAPEESEREAKRAVEAGFIQMEEIEEDEK